MANSRMKLNDVVQQNDSRLATTYDDTITALYDDLRCLQLDLDDQVAYNSAWRAPGRKLNHRVDVPAIDDKVSEDSVDDSGNP